MAIVMRSWLSWQVVALGAGSMLVGASLSAIVVSRMAMAEVEALASGAYRKDGRIALLESIVLQRTASDVRSLDELSFHAGAQQSPAPVNPTGRGGALAAAVALKRDPAAKLASSTPTPHAHEAPAPKAPGPAAAPLPAATPTPAAAAVAAAAGSPAQNSVASPVGSPVSGEELIEAMRNPRTEGMPADKVGVRALERDAVTLRNGTTIRVGSSFPSGERLLLVDPENARVVTNQRQLLLFFPKPAAGLAPSPSTQGAP